MLNKVSLIGNCGDNPEIRTTKSGDEVANIRLAVSEKWKDKLSGEQKEYTEWINITVWGNLVQVVKNYVKKGSKIYVEGKYKTRQWEKNGEKRYSTEVVLQGFGGQLILLDSKATDGASTEQLEPIQQKVLTPSEAAGEDDDIDQQIPF